MTLLDHRDLDNWRISPTTTHDHPAIADFLATTDGIGGRKFAADSRDVAEQLDGAFPDAVIVVRDVHRHPWMLHAALAMTTARPDAVVVEIMLP